MKNINQVFLMIMAVSIFLMTSCKKDPIDTIEPLEPIEVVPSETSENPIFDEFEKVTSSGIVIECITIFFPLELITANGNIIAINDSTEADSPPLEPGDSLEDFVYPIIGEDEEGNPIALNSLDELANVFFSCNSIVDLILIPLLLIVTGN